MPIDPTSEKGLDLYAQQMEQIKLRIDAIELVVNKQFHTPYRATDVEFCALQLRKTIEGILFSSLITNSDIYKQEYARLEKEWNARCIANDLRRINELFYPRPIRVVHHPELVKEHEDGTRHTGDEFLDVNTYIEPDEIIGVYEKLGKFMHERNPFASDVDYAFFETLIRDTVNDIKRLLNCHLARMIGGNYIYYVCMKSSETGNVHVALFERREDG